MVLPFYAALRKTCIYVKEFTEAVRTAWSVRKCKTWCTLPRTAKGFWFSCVTWRIEVSWHSWGTFSCSSLLHSLMFTTIFLKR